MKWISCLCWNPSQSTMLLLLISRLGTSLRKSACEIAPVEHVSKRAGRTNQRKARGPFSQERVRRRAVDRFAQGCANDVVLEL